MGPAARQDVRRFRLAALLAAMVGASLLAAPPLAAHEPGQAPDHHDDPAGQQSPDKAAADVTLHDLELRDQDGRALRFASEAVGERIVVIEFFYTNCTTVCPITTAILAQAQDALADHLGREVRFVSITVDPDTDTPRRIKAYAQAHGAGPGWLWLTGEKALVNKVLTGLGAYSADFIDHPSMFLVGDGRGGRWVRLFGLPAPDQIVAKVEELLAARRQSTQTSEGIAQE